MRSDLFWHFPYYLFRWKNKDRKELEPVQWKSQRRYHPFPFDERRGRHINRRLNNRRHSIPRDDFFVLLRDDRAGPRRTTHQQCASCQKLFLERQPFHQHGRHPDLCPNERRNPLRCQFCRVVFHDRFALLAHVPCPKSFEIVEDSEGLADRIQRILRQGIFQSEDKKLFRELFDASLSDDAFELACKCGVFRYRNEEAIEQNRERFRTDWFCQFSARVRPKLIDAENSTPEQIEDVSCIQKEYFRSPSPRQEVILCELFFCPSLAKMAKRETPGRPPSPPSAVTKNPQVKSILERKEGKKAIAALEAIGVEVPPEKSEHPWYLKKLRTVLGISSFRRSKSTRS